MKKRKCCLVWMSLVNEERMPFFVRRVEGSSHPPSAFSGVRSLQNKRGREYKRHKQANLCSQSPSNMGRNSPPVDSF